MADAAINYISVPLSSASSVAPVQVANLLQMRDLPISVKSTYLDINEQHQSFNRHGNGGGWVAASATVSADTYVGPRVIVMQLAQAINGSRLDDEAILRGNAIVDGATVRGRAMLSAFASVGPGSDISGRAQISGRACVVASKVHGNAVVTDFAEVRDSEIGGAAIIAGGSSVLDGSQIIGQIAVGMLMEGLSKPIGRYDLVQNSRLHGKGTISGGAWLGNCESADDAEFNVFGGLITSKRFPLVE